MPLPCCPLSQWVPQQRKCIPRLLYTTTSVFAQTYPQADLMVYSELIASYWDKDPFCIFVSLSKELSVPLRKTWFSVQALDHKKWVKIHVHNIYIHRRCVNFLNYHGTFCACRRGDSMMCCISPSSSQRQKTAETSQQGYVTWSWKALYKVGCHVEQHANTHFRGLSWIQKHSHTKKCDCCDRSDFFTLICELFSCSSCTLILCFYWVMVWYHLFIVEFCFLM